MNGNSTIKLATKIVFLICLVSITVIPILVWAVSGRDLDGVAGFVVACTGPLGVLTAAMAASGVLKKRSVDEG